MSQIPRNEEVIMEKRTHRNSAFPGLSPLNPGRSSRQIDMIPAWKTGWRKLIAFLNVSQKKFDGPLPQQEFIARISAIQSQASQSNDLGERTTALWRMERLGVTLGRQALPGCTLNDPRLPTEARPIAHVGLGAGAVERASFEPARITTIIESLSHPDYYPFAYESLGLMLGAYEKSIPRILLGLKPLKWPDPEACFRSFSPEIQRLISHGYGRILYFASKDIATTLRNIRRRQFLQLAAGVQGMAFGYAMVNNKDLGCVLETGDGLQDPGLIRAFKNGLVYALEFWEWLTPGFLKSLEPETPRQSSLITAAQKEIDESRAGGFLKAFAVDAEISLGTSSTVA